ncbi:thiamine monophosphate synthase [Chromatium weissei]|nr:thiamine monophosphate synthase [Chromatium weissei]
MVGIIRDASGRVLISQRPPQVDHGGLWEFPGGKVEFGESPETALARELAEELGIQVISSQPLRRVRHVYSTRTVLLDVRRITAYSGIPHGREGQPLDWVLPDDLNSKVFPAANRPIIAALRLPQLLQITDGNLTLAREIQLLQFRAHDLADTEYNQLAHQLFTHCEQHGVRLLLNRAPDCVAEVPRHGLHLTSHRLMKLTERPGAATELIGASCHNAAQLARAEQLELDYALLSPVQSTASHPDAATLGWARFAELVTAVTLPVYALGGLTPADLPTALAHGAHGIAGIRGFYGAQ